MSKSMLDEEDSSYEDYEDSDSSSSPPSKCSVPLNPIIKQGLLAVTHKKILHPFDSMHQKMFKEYTKHVDELTIKTTNLSEEGLLLFGATRIYTSQIDSVVESVHYLRTLVKTQKANRIQKQNDKIKGISDEDKANAKESSKQITNELKADETDETQRLEVEVKMELVDDDAQGDKDINESVSLSGNPTIEGSASDGVINDGLDSVPGSIVPEENLAIDSGIESEFSPEESQQILSEIPGPNTRKRAQTLQEILNLDENGEPVKKKPKKEINLFPPVLISCYEELIELKKLGHLFYTDEDDSCPPILHLAVRLSRRKNVFYAEDNIKPEKKPHEFKIKSDSKDNSKVVCERDENSLPNQPDSLEKPVQTLLSEFAEGLISSTVTPAEIFQAPINAATFSSEDQTAIQECINELHYLPFTFELTKSDLASAFNRTVERMSQIFQKNNVKVTRNMVKEASVIASSSLVKEDEKPGGSNGIIHPAVLNLGDIYNTFVKSCREECESFMTNSKAILERTKEKSFAESRANIRAMITELQRNIVPKFAQVPLMAENTPEFFQHVTNFEKRMKRVLEEEAKKDEFDVRKYERDVLEVTVKESNDTESVYDDFLMPQSPVKSLSIDGELTEIIQASQSTRSSFDGSQSSCGSSWVPLKHIFNHMKSIDKTEAARLFYAVLALLSYQNLDMNYDQLYSAESAALITHQLRNLTTKEDENDNKYQRGFKIMNSRCPDVDKEEVFVAALTVESRDEAFRHLLAQESNKLDIKTGGPGVSSSEHVFEEGIAEAMADFVEESGSVFEGRLEGRKRKKKTDS